MDLIVFAGLPGSGKSYFYRERFKDTHQHVSKDLMPGAKNRNQRQEQMIEEALSHGRSVVVDNTNPRIIDRAPLIALGKRFRARVIAYYFDCPVRECVERNKRRQGKERVPDVAIYVASKRMQKPEPEEGFDEVFTVQLTPDLAFVVK